MKEPKISVIIPVYNVEIYLDECVGSVVEQTYHNLEIILVDDGSPDGCPQRCDQWAKLDSRIRVVHKENGGVSTARNQGLDIATGEYVYFLDSDDWLEKNTMEKLVGVLKRDNVDCVGFSFLKEFDNRSQRENNVLWEEKTYRNEEFKKVFCRTIALTGKDLMHLQKTNAFCVIWSKLYKKSVIDQNGLRFIDIKRLGTFEDGLFNIAFFSQATSFAYIDEALYHYRKTNVQSVTYNYKPDFYNKQYEQIISIKNLISLEDDDLIQEAYNNRIAYMAMEYCSNALKNKAKFGVKYKELKRIFKDSFYLSSLKKFSAKKLPFFWKIYYTFLKVNFALGVYVMTASILKVRSRNSNKRI
ncbi:MAG: glycosyltransferase family 2 protein [Clostridia bacterium]|nr:glycosyltransferase family 2 protein [Clostridia bacterium]